MSERVIKPLREYEVFTHIYLDGRDQYESERFAADDYTVEKNGDGDVTSVRFWNTGNLIKEYFGSPVKVVINPID